MAYFRKFSCGSGEQVGVGLGINRATRKRLNGLESHPMVNGIICYGRSMLAKDQEKAQREKGVLLYYGCQMELLNKVITE